MSRNPGNKMAAVALMGVALTFASAMARAEAKPQSQCKSSELAAWYDAQRQLTDGKPEAAVAAVRR